MTLINCNLTHSPVQNMRVMQILVIILFSTTSLISQDLQHRLRVMDSNEGIPLIGATVELNSGFSGVTDSEGYIDITHQVVDTAVIKYIGFAEYLLVYSPSINTPEFIGLSEATTLLQTATVTSSRYEKPLSESTVSIDVLSPEFLERNGATDLQDGLNRMPGVQLIDGQANIRGGAGWSYGAGSRVMLLLDDMPILQVDAGIANWNDLPLENIGSVEILKGASSALYGSSALNGVIHFRSNFAKGEPETEIALQGTLFDMPSDSTEYRTSYSSNISLVHRRKMGKFDLVLGGFYRNEEGFRQGTYQKLGRVTTQLRYRITDRFIVGLNGFWAPATSRTYFFWDATNSFRGTETGYNLNVRTRYNIDPYLKFDVGNWSHKVQGRLYKVQNENDDNQGNDSDMYYGEYQAQYRNTENGLSLAGGLVHNYTNSISELYSDTSFQNLNTAVYLQVDQRLSDRWNVSAGVRWERNELRSPEVIFGDTIPDGVDRESKPVFRAGVNYRAAKGTYLRASWGQGYRFPSIAEKFINTNAAGIDIRPNPSLESESGWTTEIGIRQGALGRNWNGYLDLSFFRSEYDNMMEFGASQAVNFGLPFFISQNIGAVRIDGVELNGFFQYKKKRWTCDAQWGITHINPRFIDWDSTGNGQRVNDPDLTLSQRNAANSTSDDDILKYRNRTNFKFDVQLGYGYFFVGGNLNRTSQMESIDRVLAAFIPGLQENGEYKLENSRSTVVDFRVGFKYDSFSFQIMAKNLTDQRYWSRPGYLEAPRHFTARMDYAF